MEDDKHGLSDHQDESQISVSMEHEGGESEEVKKAKNPPSKKMSSVNASLLKKRTGTFKEDSMNYKSNGEPTETVN